MASSVTITESVLVAASPEEVWQFTWNDLSHPLLSDSCGSPKILELRLNKLVRFESCGRFSGCWTYEANGKGTLWSQTNTVLLEGPLERLLGSLLRFRLRRATRARMKKVKESLQFSGELSGSLHEDFF